MRHEKLIVLFAFILFYSFLGFPIPDWLSGFVSSLAGTIMAIVAGFSKLIAFVQFFIRF